MATPSLSEQMFKQITAQDDKAAFFKAIPGDKESPYRYETEWLDFKQAPNINDNSVKENWSKALSGFANTGGGILVWGIGAKKDESGVDCANAICSVENPAALKSRLMQLHHMATDPPVLGVTVEAYDDNETAGRGFVVCYIPASEHRPHRAEHAGRIYYLRAGDDFIAAPHSLLRAMFYPRVSAKLWIEVDVDWSAPDHRDDFRLHYTLKVRNTGTASASNVYVVIHKQAGNVAPGSFPEWELRPSAERKVAFSGRRAIHPGDSSLICNLEESIPARGLRIPRHSTTLEVAICATDYEMEFSYIVIGEYDFINRASVKAVPSILNPLR